MIQNRSSSKRFESRNKLSPTQMRDKFSHLVNTRGLGDFRQESEMLKTYETDYLIKEADEKSRAFTEALKLIEEENLVESFIIKHQKAQNSKISNGISDFGIL